MRASTACGRSEEFAHFPLTPDLFPEEREKDCRLYGHRGCCGLSVALAVLLPLLWEEVRGEGERACRNPSHAGGTTASLSAYSHLDRCAPPRLLGADRHFRIGSFDQLFHYRQFDYCSASTPHF